MQKEKQKLEIVHKNLQKVLYLCVTGKDISIFALRKYVIWQYNDHPTFKMFF